MSAANTEPLKIVIAGPLETAAVGAATGIDVTGLPPGSVQTPLSTITSGLLRSGHAVHLVTTDVTVDAPLTFERGPLTVTYCPLRGAPRYRARARMGDLFEKEIRYLEEAMRSAKGDIVHAHWTYEFAEAAVRSGLPHLVTMRDLGWQYFFQFRDLYRFVRLVMKYRTMPRVRNVSVIAPFMAEKGRTYGYFGAVDVVPNPLTAASWTSKSGKPQRIAAIGNAGRIKNVSAAVAALPYIRSRFPEAELHLFGPGLDGNAGPELRGDGVVGHGHIKHKDLMDFLAKEATLLIHPARLETFGVIVAEAKMRGVPVVAGARSGGVEFVVGGAGGLLTDIEDPQAIADAACKILSDPDYAAMHQDENEDVIARLDTKSFRCPMQRTLARQTWYQA